MRATEALKDIIHAQNLTIAKVADRLNIARNALNMRLNRDNDITMGKVVDIARSLDYKIVIMPRDVKLPKDSYEVE